jgi:hypothetical protein
LAVVYLYPIGEIRNILGDDDPENGRNRIALLLVVLVLAVAVGAVDFLRG